MIKKFNSFNENNYSHVGGIVNPSREEQNKYLSFVTEDGKKLLDLIQDSYPSLLKYYAREVGQFSFTKNELEQQLPAVLSWMEENVGWGLVCSEGSFILYEMADGWG